MVDEPKKEPEQESQEPEENNQESNEEPEIPQVEAVDEDGVPYKNRAAEYKRKYEEAVANQNAMDVHQPPQPQQAPPKPAQKDPKVQVDEFVQMGPEAWYEQRRAKERQQEGLQQADRMIYDQDPANYRQNVAKVISVARKYNIDMTTDPVRGVKAVQYLIEQEQKLSSSSKSAVKKEADKKRVQEIKKKQTEGGTKPPAPPVDKSSEHLESLQRRGSDEDAVNFLKSRLFKDK
jgi:hypothetical protein